MLFHHFWVVWPRECHPKKNHIILWKRANILHGNQIKYYQKAHFHIWGHLAVKSHINWPFLVDNFSQRSDKYEEIAHSFVKMLFIPCHWLPWQQFISWKVSGPLCWHLNSWLRWIKVYINISNGYITHAFSPFLAHVTLDCHPKLDHVTR